MTKTRNSQGTLFYAAKIFIVYLRTLKLPYTQYEMYMRCLRHILKFYGSEYNLECFHGGVMLQYAELYDPYSRIETYHERGKVFWTFMYFLKNNKMVPDWTAPEKSGH